MLYLSALTVRFNGKGTKSHVMLSKIQIYVTLFDQE